MPVSYATPIVSTLTINASEAQGLSVNNKGRILDIPYYDGNLNGVIFTPIGEMKNLHIEGAAFDAVLAAYPTLYPTLKGIINTLIAQSKGVAGTSV